ncbi:MULTISPECIES: hypothetical protein [unclassified Bradyrhizobium]|uniref:hypothetical protein n=1 Tax=unclassified Bradyrhizobium TaxID=2631580 RepID=UPI002305711B|nr:MULTISPECIES: hypothetical protein [unclassified Bradyrhizobium]
MALATKSKTAPKKRAPIKTARNKEIAAMTAKLRALLPDVFAQTGIKDEASLNAKIGGKADEFIDLKNEVITSPLHYVTLYLDSFEGHLSTTGWKTAYDELYETSQASDAAQEYLMLFLERSYLKHYEEYSKKTASVGEAEVWMGQNNADYGLLVTPRFENGDWENDKSEIRHFKPGYWTVGHAMETGLVIPGKNKKRTFTDVDDLLDFLEDIIVRHSGSKCQVDIAARYSAFVRGSADPLNVPLLIPELRFEGRAKARKYRLDFCIIDGSTMQKTGFELSPWASHGMLTATKGKLQKDINAEASANFDKEMAKHKAYFKKHGIFASMFTDADLEDLDNVWAYIADFLEPKEMMAQMNLHLRNNFFKNKKKPRKP